MLTVVIGLIISSTTSSIIVFAQELVPHRFGMISGVFFGVAFGIGGLGAAALGRLADATSIAFVYHVCPSLPAIGLLAVFLPKMPQARPARESRAKPACENLPSDTSLAIVAAPPSFQRRLSSLAKK